MSFSERNEGPPAALDFSALAAVKFPGGVTFLPTGPVGFSSTFVDLSSAQTIAGSKSFSAAVNAPLYQSLGGKGVLGVYNVKDFIAQHGGQTIGQLTAQVVVPAVGATVTVNVTTPNFVNGQNVCIWDYQYCFSGLIVSGGGTTTLGVQNVQLNGPPGTPYATTAGVTVTTGTTQAWGIQADDAAGINAAITAANADPVGILFWPAGQYVTSSTLTIHPSVSWKMGGQCGIRPTAGVLDCFHVLSGNQGGGQFASGTTHDIPSCFYFPGTAFTITDANISYMRVHQNTIMRCGKAFVATASTNGTMGTFGIWYDFHIIENCWFAIHLLSTGGSNDGFQGINVTSNGIIIGCSYAIYFQSTNYAAGTVAGSTLTLTSYTGNRFHNGDSLFIYDTTNHSAALVVVTAGGGTSTITFNILQSSGGAFGSVYAVPYFTALGNNIFDIAGVNGNTVDTSGIMFDGGVFAQNYFRSASSWGAFGSGKYIVSSNGGLCQNSCFDFQFYAGPGTLAPTYADFAALQSPAAFWAASNLFRMAYGGAIPMIGSSLKTYTATTTANSRATFNGGLPVLNQRFHIAMTTLTTGGQVADFYVYSPFTTGDTATLKFTPQFDTAIAPMCYFASLTDQSVTHPNEIRIRVATPGAFTTAQTVFGILSVGE